ncbi:MAG: flagellar biosynthesis protein FlhA, partial [Gammaproteobacteria bacterium]|nr:flagellar biosynthesis protein FlhA [Gammaproteobacteria bacterium]
IIVTRAASDEYLSKEITKQITAYPKTLVIIGVGLLGLLMLPGIPAWPVLLMLVAIGVLAVIAYRRSDEPSAQTNDDESSDADDDLLDMMSVEAIEVSIGKSLIPLIKENAVFNDRISAFRKQFALDMGMIIPSVHLRDHPQLGKNNYEIHINGAKVGDSKLHNEGWLAINPGQVQKTLVGEQTKDPTYGLDAIWINPDQKSEAKQAGYTLVDPATILLTHLTERIKRHAAELLTRADTEILVNKVRERDSGLVGELVPNVLSLSEVQRVLQNLLNEEVSIKNLRLILEVLVEHGRQTKEPERLTELVRNALGPVICQNLLASDGQLHVLTLEPSIERTMATSIKDGNGRPSMILEPKLAQQIVARLLAQMEKMMSKNLMPVLLCAPELRYFIRHFTQRTVPHLSVVSMAEVPTTVQLNSFGMVNVS